ncbi:MAG: hypothetical protein ACOYN3_09420 [Acidimicrobiia bacterium]
MQLVSALFTEEINMRPAPGPSTRIDLTGVFFSMAAPALPCTLTPHLVVLIRTTPGGPTNATLVCEFHRDDELVARNVQPVAIEPGKFGYRLVRPELTFAAPGTIVATCTISETGSAISVPLTVLNPV